MHITVTNDKTIPPGEGNACVLLPVYEDEGPAPSALIDGSTFKALAELRSRTVIKGKSQETYFYPTPGRPTTGTLTFGLGPRSTANAETVRRGIGKAVESLRRNQIARVAVDASSLDQPAAVVEGIMLGQYQFDSHKSSVTEPVVSVNELSILTDAATAASVKEACTRAVVICDCVNWARNLANSPSNVLTPAQLSYEARTIAERFGIGWETLDAGHMAELGMNALLGVARGSKEPPKLIVLNYHHSPDSPTLAIVGKGITFDTGGVSIKPSEGMHEMKFDMCGAAAVLGAMKAIAQIKPPINVIAIAPAAENVVDGSAQRPGDIVKAFNGKTIEIHNTDAEGRLILADALAYTVQTYHPDKIVDLATLTGACIVALGHYAAAVMTTDDGLYASLQSASDATGERIWRLPLWDDYSKLIEGTHADLCNIGPAREAGSIIGGCFLREFIGTAAWAHIDIAGTAWGAKNISYLDAKHATGYGVRLLTEWIRGEAAR